MREIVLNLECFTFIASNCRRKERWFLGFYNLFILFILLSSEFLTFNNFLFVKN